MKQQVMTAPGNIIFREVQDHELNLLGTAMYRVEDWRESIDLVSQGRIQLKSLITHRLPFGEYEEAYHLIDRERDKAMKVMIDLEG